MSTENQNWLHDLFIDEAKAAMKSHSGEGCSCPNDSNSNGGSGGIIDVEYLAVPDYGYENYNGNAIYRLPMGLYAVGIAGDGRTHYFKHGTTYDVKTLPEVGEPATTDGETVNAVYYCRDDNDAYGYIQETIAAALGVSVGWYDIRTLASAFGFTYVGIVNNVRKMKVDNSLYFVDNHSYFSFKNGLSGSLSSSETTLLTIDFEDVDTPVKLSSGLASRIRADFENTKIIVSQSSGSKIVLNPSMILPVEGGVFFIYNTCVMAINVPQVYRVNVTWSQAGAEAVLSFEDL